MKEEVKRMMRKAKRRTNEEWYNSITENFMEDKNKFWRRINEITMRRRRN